MSKASVISFDVYGTLVRWEESVTEMLRAIADPAGVGDGDIETAKNIFEAESHRLQSVGAFRSFRDILLDSLRPALTALEVEYDSATGSKAISQLAAVPPHPEVPGILRRLSDSYRLAPISNSDDDLLAGTLKGIGVPFSTVVTAQQAAAYKPNPRLFWYALDRLGVGASELIHVAQGTFSDLAVCTALGIRVIWVNRTGQLLQEGLAPVSIIPDLDGLPEALENILQA